MHDMSMEILEVQAKIIELKMMRQLMPPIPEMLQTLDDAIEFAEVMLDYKQNNNLPHMIPSSCLGEMCGLCMPCPEHGQEQPATHMFFEHQAIDDDGEPHRIFLCCIHFSTAVGLKISKERHSKRNNLVNN